MERIAYLLAVDVPRDILVGDKLEVLIGKDLVVVETYPLVVKPDG